VEPWKFYVAQDVPDWAFGEIVGAYPLKSFYVIERPDPKESLIIPCINDVQRDNLKFNTSTKIILEQQTTANNIAWKQVIHLLPYMTIQIHD